MPGEMCVRGAARTSGRSSAPIAPSLHHSPSTVVVNFPGAPQFTRAVWETEWDTEWRSARDRGAPVLVRYCTGGTVLVVYVRDNCM